MIHYWGNMIEGFFWLTVAAILYWQSRKEPDRRLKGVADRAGLVLFWFGISDFIEVGTGAWYRPFGLLLLKAGCIAFLLYCFIEYLRLRKREREDR